jgi:hypothetical protein
MKKVLLLAVVGVMFASVGCVTVHNNKAASTNMPVAVAEPAQYQAITEIGQDRVSATVTGNSLMGIINWGMPNTFADGGMVSSDIGTIALPSFMDVFGKFKLAAIYCACEENNCDSLMDARYIITTKDYYVFKQVICTVTGIPVKVTGYKLIDKK